MFGVGGNSNFGADFGKAGDVIFAKCKVPYVYRFELMGSYEDLKISREGLISQLLAGLLELLICLGQILFQALVLGLDVDCAGGIQCDLDGAAAAAGLSPQEVQETLDAYEQAVLQTPHRRFHTGAVGWGCE